MQDNIATAVAYYTALGSKKIKEVEKCLHPHIHFTDPQEKVIGKEAVLRAAKSFMRIFTALTIRAQLSSEEQVAIVYDVEIPGLAKSLHAVSLLSFEEGLISSIEVTYDTSCFAQA